MPSSCIFDDQDHFEIAKPRFLHFDDLFNQKQITNLI